MGKKRIFLFIVFSIIFNLFSHSIFAQSSANDITLEDEIENLTKQLEKTQAQEKRIQLLEKIARAQEFSNMFPEAEESYFACAELANADQKVMYILKAARCSLSYGNTERTDELLAKIANGARSNEYAPLFKLYAVWNWLSKCTSYDETYEPIAVLKSYLELDSMKTVRPQMLFTLWFVTGQIQYASRLKAEYPLSAEYAVVSGQAELAPSPFWFFASRKLPDEKEAKELAELTKDSKSTSAKSYIATDRAYEVNPDSGRSAGSASTKSSSASTKSGSGDAKSAGIGQAKSSSGSAKVSTEVTKVDSRSTVASSSKSTTGKSIIKYYQLGFFSKEENALALVKKAADKNIKAEIREEVRSSGNKYYAVIVMSSDEKMGTIIRNSGFECYPIY